VNYFQPLFVLDLDVYFRDTRDLQWIKEASFSGSIPDFQGDIVKSTQVMFLSEVLMKVLKEEEKNEALFDFLYRSVSYLESLENGSSSFHLFFLFQLTRFLGFYPRKNYDSERIFFDRFSGSFVTVPPAADIETEKLLGGYWNRCFDLTYNDADQLFSNKYHRNLFLDSLLDFYRHQVDSLGDIKSVEVLRVLFS